MSAAQWESNSIHIKIILKKTVTNEQNVEIQLLKDDIIISRNKYY